MGFQIANYPRLNRWNRMVLTFLWMICLLYIIGELIMLFLRLRYYPEYSVTDYIHRYILIPDFLLLSIMILSEVCCRSARKYREEILLACSLLLANAILYTIHPVIGGGEYVLILPMLVAIYFTNVRMLFLSLAINLGTFIPIYCISPERQQYLSIYEFCIFLLILIGVAIAGYGAIRRGMDLLRDMEELAKSEEKLLIEKTLMDKLSKTDALTGLNNHITFHEYADSAIAQCDSSGMPLAMALMDIDDFKKINDTLGHKAGDTVLKKIGGIIRQNVTPDDFTSRYGGEEFALVFAGKGIEESYDIVERIRKGIENSLLLEDTPVRITISAGLHCYHPGEGKESLFERVDKALYLAKHSGKNRTCLAPGEPQQ